MNFVNLKEAVISLFHSLNMAIPRLCRWTGIPEQEQAALRILIPSSVLIYLTLNKPVNTSSLSLWESGITFVLCFLVFSCALYLSTIIWPNPSHTRKVLGILVDTIGQSLALHLTGPVGAPWYGIYLWVILGNGFRYGEKYLYLSTAISIIGFAYVSITTPYWEEHAGLAIGLAFTLLLIPAYSAILIRRLNEARQRADAASRAKSDFLSCMSHEIRTPLNGILGMTDLLRLRPLPDEDKECIETIHVSGHALARQINEILDLSKIEAGRMTVETIDFDLFVLINTTLRIFQNQAEDKGLTLCSIIDPATPYLLSGDPHKIRQIITNLVGNALKFTRQGSITLKIKCLQPGSEHTRLRFEVRDTGTGIPEDKLHLIFEPFTQASDSVARNYGGTGLGTTICKNLVELMDGSIGIESTLDVGSTFWFELPFKVNQSQATATRKNWASHCKVLHLSQADAASDPVLAKLADWGIAHDACGSIEQAFAAAINTSGYDAIIVHDMPSSDLLTSLIRGTDTRIPRKLHVILINPENDTMDIPEERPTLFLLHSPVQDDILLNVLHACYSRHGTEDEIVHFTRKQAQGAQATRKLNILVSDDNATNRIVMQRMLDKLGHRHTIVDGGEAALLALENERFDAVVIDKNMPDMGGLEVFQAYCFAHGGVAPVEFAILTADATEEARASCEAAGIRHFLTKPVSLVRLTETLSDMCGSDQASADDSVTSPEEDQSTIVSGEVFNAAEFDNLAELAGGDHSFVREIVENFISDTNRNIKALEAAVARGEWMEFRDLAHALKGSSLYLGLTQLAELSRNAQDITQQDFRNDGVNQVVAIRKAADTAFSVISGKLSEQPGSRITSQAI